MATMRRDNGQRVAIVGGGLAGLAAASYLARAGQAVTLYEQADTLGGRARTQDHEVYLFNFGPHALYRGGVGATVLRELGVAWSGKNPPTNAHGLRGDRLGPLPGGPRSFLTTPLLAAGGKVALLGLFAKLLRLDPAPLQRVTLRDWLDREVRRDDVRALFAMLARVATYSADLERLSAGAALAQVRMALQDQVAYLDGGWQTLVAGLRRAAESAGAVLNTGAHVAAVTRDRATGAACGVRLADGATGDYDAVVIAASPRVARALVERAEETPLPEWEERAIPVQAACLDVALRSLPRPDRPVVFGLDRPLYLAVHSGSARLAPGAGVVLHVAKYLRRDEPSDPHADERELLALLDRAQPGWRARVVTRRTLPKLIVTNSLVRADEGGLAGRPGPAVPGVPGLYVAGDWVGAAGMLADGALASGREAAALIAAAPIATRRPGLLTV